MIAENLPEFNAFPIPQHFDDPEVRLRAQLRQDAVPTLSGGRHLLYSCPVCKRPFYLAGKSVYPRLTEEQLAHLCSTFHADVHALHLLPQAWCSICSAIYLGGLITIEEYRCGSSCLPQGYALRWECASSPYASLVAIVYQPAWTPLCTFLTLQPDTLLASVQQVQAFLAWLERCPCPAAARLFDDDERQVLASRLPPSSVWPDRPQEGGEPRLWWGYAWKEICPCLGTEEPALVSLAVTVSPLAPASLENVVLAWRLLACALRLVW